MDLIDECKRIWYTCAANQPNPNPMEETAMKKVMNILFAWNRREETRQEAPKARCYVCINGIVIPVL